MRFLGHLFSLFAVLFVGGAAALAAVIWWYGRELPEYEQLVDYRPPELSRVYAAGGVPIAEFAQEKRFFAEIDEIPALVQHAFVSAEDKNFYRHIGVDFVGIGKALGGYALNKAQGRDANLRGASTITQQVMKNFLLTSRRNLERKVKEAILAIRAERVLTKDRILELYLNEIYLGARSYGVAAAAQNYFGKALVDLTPEEAAYLAALPKAPSRLHPVRDHDAAITRRNYVLREMAENGYLTATQAEAARAAPLDTILSEDGRGGGSYDWRAAYMIEEVRGSIIDTFGEEMVYGGGLRIETTLDMELQEKAGRALIDGLSDYDRRGGWRGPVTRIDTGDGPDVWREALSAVDAPRDIPGWELAVVVALDEDSATIGFADEDRARGSIPLEALTWARLARDGGRLGPEIKAPADVLSRGDVVYVAATDEAKGLYALRQKPEAQGAVVAMEIATGRILAMQGGTSAQDSIFNRVTQAQRQPGSSFKPVVYAAALDHGYTPASIVLDAPVTVDQGTDDGLWRPENYERGRHYGPIPLRIGLEKSRNLITVRLAQDVGMDTVADYARRLGVYDNMPRLLSYSLGAGETTLLKMATAYATFANGGRLVRPRMIEAVRDRSGALVEAVPAEPAILAPAIEPGQEPVAEAFPELAEPAADPDQVIDPVTAYQVVSLMRGVVLRGTATRLSALGLPIAGKTGTTNDAKDAWFIGFTPDIVFGCYIGHDTPRSLGSKASGGALCGPIVHQFMGEVFGDSEVRDFPVPEGIVTARIDRLTGRGVPEGAEGKDIILEAFRAGTEPEIDDDYAPVTGGFLTSSGPTAGETPQAILTSIAPQQAPQAAQPGPKMRPILPNGSPVIADSELAQMGQRLSLDLDTGRTFDPVTGYVYHLESGMFIDPRNGAVVVAESAAQAAGYPVQLTPARAPEQPLPAPVAQPSTAGGGTSMRDAFGGHGLY